MLAATIIVLRETLEICLIIGIISAALNNLKNKRIILLSGIAGGCSVSYILALTIDYISKLFNNNGQEILNIVILTLSVICIVLTLVWINRHSKELHNKINETKDKVISNQGNILALIFIIVLAISREGAELILFLNGVYASGTSPSDLFLGSLIGAGIGIFIGFLLYAGLLKLHVKYFFKAINVMLILLAAGMASQIANYLNATDFIQVFSATAWDSSWIANESSFSGKIIYNTPKS